MKGKSAMLRSYYWFERGKRREKKGKGGKRMEGKEDGIGRDRKGREEERGEREGKG